MSLEAVPDRQPNVHELLEQIDEKHTAGHKRVRDTLVEVQDQVENNFQHFATKLESLRTRIEVVEAQTARPDASKLTLTTYQITGVVGAALVIAASYWTMTARVAALESKIIAQEDKAAQTAKVQDAQYQQLRDAVAAGQK